MTKGASTPDGVFRPMLPGQVCQLRTFDLASGEESTILETGYLIEAPNLHPDGRRCIVNGWGRIFAVDVATGAIVPVPVEGVDTINNDHLLTRDGRGILFCAGGAVYAVPLAGGTHERLTIEDGLAYYLHGLSPDGLQLACTTIRGGTDGPRWGLALVPAAGGASRMLIESHKPLDGPEWSPDGEWLWFNGELLSSVEGHSSLLRLHLASGAVERMTADERVDWFPHVTPAGGHVVYLSYPPGTVGHPANRDVQIRVLDLSGGGSRTLARLTGGQGSINVGSFAPGGTTFAYVAYPVATSGAARALTETA